MPDAASRTLSPDLPTIPRIDRSQPAAVPPLGRVHEPEGQGEDGSLITEYGLLAVLGATIVGLAIKWAAGGAIWELLDAVLSKAKALVGA